jgi:hypothetical protein
MYLGVQDVLLCSFSWVWFALHGEWAVCKSPLTGCPCPWKDAGSEMLLSGDVTSCSSSLQFVGIARWSMLPSCLPEKSRWRGASHVWGMDRTGNLGACTHVFQMSWSLILHEFMLANLSSWRNVFVNSRATAGAPLQSWADMCGVQSLWLAGHTSKLKSDKVMLYPLGSALELSASVIFLVDSESRFCRSVLFLDDFAERPLTAVLRCQSWWCPGVRRP